MTVNIKNGPRRSLVSIVGVDAAGKGGLMAAPPINVKDFGAKCDGSTDDTTAVQAAINAAVAVGGGIVMFPIGSCVINGSALTVNSGAVYLQGQGAKASSLSVTTSRSTDLIQFTGSAFYGGLSDLGISFFSTPSAGAAINIGAGSSVGAQTIEGVLIVGAYNGININQGSGGTTRILNVDFNSSVNDAIQINSTNSATIDGVTSFQNTLGGGAGLHFLNGAGIIVSNGFYDRHTHALLINPGVGQTVLDCWFSNLDLDASAISGITIDTTASLTSFARNMTFSDVRTGFANDGSNTVGRGIYLDGSGTSDITFNGGEDVQNIQEGIYIHGGLDIRICNRLVLGNSVAGLNVWNGINIDAAFGDRYAIIGGAVGRYYNSNLQNFGISIQNTFPGEVTIDGVDVRGNSAAAGIVNNGTGTLSKIVNNTGYNPVGPKTPTVGASPWTYTAGASPEFISIYGGTVSGVTIGGVTVANQSPGSLMLAPGQSMIVTYSVVPTVKSSVQ